MRLCILAFLIILGNSIFCACKAQNKNETKQSSQELRKETNSISGVIVMDDMILLTSVEDLRDSIISIIIFSMDGSKVKTNKTEQGDLNKIDVSFLKQGKYKVLIETIDGSQFHEYIEIEK